MANGGQPPTELNVPNEEAFNEVLLTIWALIEGLLVVMEFSHIARQISYGAKRNEGVDVGRDKSSLHTPERELEARVLIWCRWTKVGGNICAMLRYRQTVLAFV